MRTLSILSLTLAIAAGMAVEVAPRVPAKEVAPKPRLPAGAEEVAKGGNRIPAAWASNAGKDQAGNWADVVVNNVVQRMRWVDPGKFTMGEANRRPAETPHEVTLTKGFWIADTECTHEFWTAVMGSAYQNSPPWSTLPQQPVEAVSYDNAMVCIGKLNTAKGVSNFTLPTMAQWEYACRAGTTTQYAGPSLDALAWFADNAADKSHAVKTKAANPWGIFDMHGNVSEWCLDYVGNVVKPDAVTDPIGSVSAQDGLREIRGGNYKSGLGSTVRSAARDELVKSHGKNQVGFRIIAVP